jgi:3-methylcrotonyl-CoA carboxylase alpha subunit
MRTLRLVHRGRAREIQVRGATAAVDGRAIPVELPGPREIRVDGRRFRIEAARDGNRIWVWCEGRVYEFEQSRGSRAAAADPHHGSLAAPMPGRVRRLVAAEGSRVARGDVLLVLEAMKMEHAIRAPHDGILERFHVAEGDLVEAGVDLAELAEERLAPETGPRAEA